MVSVVDAVPRVLVVRSPGDARRSELALPSGSLDSALDRTLELGLRRRVREQAGMSLRYVEQLYTFGDRFRVPTERQGGPRVLSIAYLALMEAQPTVDGARWVDWYDFLPWEDWRAGRPDVLDQCIKPGLSVWLNGLDSKEERRAIGARCEMAFGFDGSPWHGEHVLERYEILYQAALVAEAHRDRDDVPADVRRSECGTPMAVDHRRICATALGRLRGKISYRPLVFELLPETFTLLQLQQVVETLAGTRLHKQNFRRMIERGGLVEGTGQRAAGARGRPAERFRFRPEALRERVESGVAVPVVRR